MTKKEAQEIMGIIYDTGAGKCHQMDADLILGLDYPYIRVWVWKSETLGTEKAVVEDHKDLISYTGADKAWLDGWVARIRKERKNASHGLGRNSF